MVGAATLAGCGGPTDAEPDGGSTSSDTTTAECDALSPPKPTDAATAPRPYPTRPERLSTETVRGYVTAYERAYQYNRRLAEYPQTVGRLNELDVEVSTTSVQTTERKNRFVVDVEGTVTTEFADRESATANTPTTPTRTPLPVGHRPFSVSYVVTDRSLRRAGVVVACW